MRQELITYDIFCQTIQTMQVQGEKISIRTILSHTGGSFAKIADFLKRWRAEQAHVLTQVDRELSPNLRQALLAEIGKATADTKALFEAQLSQANDQLEEAHEALAKQEKTLAEYEQQLEQANQQIAVAHQIQTQLTEKVTSLESKLEKAIEAQHKADKQAAIAETRFVELEKQLTKLEKETEKPKTPKEVNQSKYTNKQY